MILTVIRRWRWHRIGHLEEREVRFSRIKSGRDTYFSVCNGTSNRREKESVNELLGTISTPLLADGPPFLPVWITSSGLWLYRSGLEA